MSRIVPIVVAVVLAQFALGSAIQPVAGQTALDYDIPGGHFYTQANGKAGEGGTGFAITDADGVPFWSEYRRLGGAAVLGYPISRRFAWDGFVSQAMQKVVLQWRPEQDAVLFVNVFDKMSDTGKDPWLRTVRQVPNPVKLDEQGKAWPEIVKGRLALLDSNPGIKRAYSDVKGDPIILNGLPTSQVEDFGNVFVLRAQRVVFQQWKENVPWARAGEVQIANGGDVGKEGELYPKAALEPQAAGSTESKPIPAGSGSSAPTTAPAPAPASTPSPAVARPANTPASGNSPYPRQLDPVRRTQPGYLKETPGAHWIVVRLHQLTACENPGLGIGFLETLDAAGQPIDNVLIQTASGQTQPPAYRTGEKGPGKAEAYFYRGNWTVWVVKDENGQDTTSDQAVNLDTAIFAVTPEEQAERFCNGIERLTTNHYSYQVVFRKRS